MATAQADRFRSTLVVVALAACALAALSLRAIKTAGVVADRAVPTTGLASLTSFLGPLPDELGRARPTSGTRVMLRDPFAVAAPAAPVAVSRGNAVSSSTPVKAARQHWVVSTILVEGTRKSAIVNNAWVTVGDSLGGGSRLTAVERDHVVVTDANGVRHVVRIQGGER
jgi:hypothetical protein